MNAVGTAGKCDIRPRVDKDFRPKSFANAGLSCLKHCQRKLKQLSCAHVLFSNLYEVDSEVHLVANDLKQSTESSDGFSISDVVAFHKRKVGTGKSVISYPRKCAESEGM